MFGERKKIPYVKNSTGSNMDLASFPGSWTGICQINGGNSELCQRNLK